MVNRFFTGVGHDLNAKLPESSREFPLPYSPNVMPPMPPIDYIFVETHEAKIDVNKSSGLSSINAKLLKIALASQLKRFCTL